jgi:hypothetical protein
MPGSCTERAGRRDRLIDNRGYWLSRGQDPEQVPILIQRGDGHPLTAWITTDGRSSFEEPA